MTASRETSAVGWTVAAIGSAQAPSGLQALSTRRLAATWGPFRPLGTAGDGRERSLPPPRIVSAGVGMRYFVGLLVVLLAVSVNPHLLEPPAAGSVAVVVTRYDLLRTGVAPDVGAISTPAVRWTFQTNGTVATSPLAADVDGDGKLEVVLSEASGAPAADGSRLGYVLDASGRVKYTVPLRYDASVAAIADLDGDGRPEIVFAEGSHSDQPGSLGYRVVHGVDGSPMWTFATPFIGGVGGSGRPAPADAD